MIRTHRDTPKDNEMKIPRWARIALAARTVRRVYPLLLASWADVPREFLIRVETAVAEAELAASQAAITPNQRSAGLEGMAAYASRPRGMEIAGYVAYAAAHASFAACEPKASHVSFVLEEAMWAVFYFEKDCPAPGIVSAVADAIWNDLKGLTEQAEVGQWTAKSGVPPTAFGPIWPDGAPKHWPLAVREWEVIAKRQAYQPQDVEAFDLPTDLVEFLKSGANLEYDTSATEAGPVVVKPYNHLRLDQFDVTTKGTPANSKDPHKEERGCYVVQAIDLIGECDLYDPAGILAWFPEYRRYGCWDTDHGTALVFLNATWTDIAADPGKYLDAQWNPSTDFAVPMIPWERCDFQPENR